MVGSLYTFQMGEATARISAARELLVRATTYGALGYGSKQDKKVTKIIKELDEMIESITEKTLN